jgi:transposase
VTGKNKDLSWSKISKKKTREIIKLYSLDLEASPITQIIGLNRNIINRYLVEIDMRISDCQFQSPFSRGN